MISTALRNLITVPSPMASAIREGADHVNGDTAVAAPHQVYSASLQSVAEAEMLSSSIAKCWRYLFLIGEEVQGVIELPIDEAGSVSQFSNINRGPFLESLIEGVGFAENLERIRENDYELRVLSVPSLYLEALWLRGTLDLLIPLAPTPNSLEPLRVYSEEQMVSALLELILNRQSTDRNGSWQNDDKFVDH